MNILGIESSADETSASVVENGVKLLSLKVASSMDMHKAYGGVVPEIAARSHIEAIIPVVDEALEDAFRVKSNESRVRKTAYLDSKLGTLDSHPGDPWSQIDAIAVTQGPGLSGSLLIGVLTARTLAIAKNKPLYAVNHVEAHVYANFITSAGTSRDAALGAPVLSQSSSSTSPSAPRSRLASHQSPTDVKEWIIGNKTYKLPSSPPQFPLLALIVSGGHSQLALFTDHFKYKLLGQTTDDAVGEAYDKVAKILGLPYPGGPSIERLAPRGNPHAIKLPKAKMQSAYDFSFSGPKTAVLRAAQKIVGKDFTLPSTELPGLLNASQKADIAASFQFTAIDTLLDATELAVKEFNPKSVVIAGGVAASSALREQINKRISQDVNYADMKLCTDNGAMIASLGYFMAKYNKPTADPYSLDIAPNLSM
jgi:N6-L-threonylcarbamoyladenine synthase